jgi:hypothetical protein
MFELSPISQACSGSKTGENANLDLFKVWLTGKQQTNRPKGQKWDQECLLAWLNSAGSVQLAFKKQGILHVRESQGCELEPGGWQR